MLGPIVLVSPRPTHAHGQKSSERLSSQLKLKTLAVVQSIIGAWVCGSL